MRPTFRASVYIVSLLIGVAGAFGCPSPLFAFEHTKVLPRGVRGLAVRTVDTRLSSKTDASGTALPLGAPLEKDLTFARIVAGEEATKGKQLQAFLMANGFSEEEAVGTFTADLKGRVQVVAPIASYGLTDSLTLALAVPYYRANTAVEVGFRQNERAAAFLAALASPEQNQIEAARDATSKLNNAVARLNAKLIENNYSALEDWQAAGVGDVTLAAKYRVFDVGPVAGAFTGGVVAPTGRTDDPDILTDIPFGDGQWDAFGQVAFDQPISHYIFINQFAKYTWQAPGRKSVRDVTDKESIEVKNISTRFKLGDKIDAGLSANYLSPGGVVVGLGRTWFRKFGDRYEAAGSEGSIQDGEARPQLSKNSDQFSEHNEFALGYSTIPAFQRGKFPAPLEIKFGLQQQVRSRNMPVSDLAQIDASLFF